MPIKDTKFDIVTESRNTITNTTTETSFFNNFPWRANTDKDSRALHYKLFWKGWYSTLADTPGTLTFKLRWGTYAFTSPSATVIASSSAIALPSGMTNQLWTLDLDLTLRNRGSGTYGKAIAIGRPILNWGSVPIVDQMPTGGSDTSINLDTSLAAQIFVTAQFSVASASNIITLTDPSAIIIE